MNSSNHESLGSHVWQPGLFFFTYPEIKRLPSISEKMVEEKDIKKTLSCTSNLDSLTYTYRMMTDDFDLTEAVELAYEVYVNVNEANSEYNTYMIDGLYVCINNFIDYNKDYQNIYVFLPFEEDYSFEEFEKILNDNIEICRDAEPV